MARSLRTTLPMGIALAALLTIGSAPARAQDTAATATTTAPRTDDNDNSGKIGLAGLLGLLGLLGLRKKNDVVVRDDAAYRREGPGTTRP